MLQIYFQIFDKYIDHSALTLVQMYTESDVFDFSDDSIDRLISLHMSFMREEYEKDIYNFLALLKLQNIAAAVREPASMA
jgi:hypothetical protein